MGRSAPGQRRRSWQRYKAEGEPASSRIRKGTMPAPICKRLLELTVSRSMCRNCGAVVSPNWTNSFRNPSRKEGRERIDGRPGASPVIGSGHIPRRTARPCRRSAGLPGNGVSKQLEQVARDVCGTVIPSSSHKSAPKNPAALTQPYHDFLVIGEAAGSPS
jgi:hypothetical protein